MNASDNNETIEMIKQKLETPEVKERISEEELHVLKLRFGVIDGKLHSLEDTGRLIGKSRERVRQLEARALRKLGRKKLWSK